MTIVANMWHTLNNSIIQFTKLVYAMLCIKFMLVASHMHFRHTCMVCMAVSIIITFFLQNKLKGCYTVIASYRPVFKYHGTLGVMNFSHYCSVIMHDIVMLSLHP